MNSIDMHDFDNETWDDTCNLEAIAQECGEDDEDYQAMMDEYQADLKVESEGDPEAIALTTGGDHQGLCVGTESTTDITTSTHKQPQAVIANYLDSLKDNDCRGLESQTRLL